MSVIGTVRNGQIVLPEGVRLPEGTEVTVEIMQKKRVPPQVDDTDEKLISPAAEGDDEEPIDGYALNRALMKFAGIVTDMPEDSSVNHDHYLYGVPKVE